MEYDVSLMENAVAIGRMYVTLVSTDGHVINAGHVLQHNVDLRDTASLAGQTSTTKCSAEEMYPTPDKPCSIMDPGTLGLPKIHNNKYKIK